MTTSDEELLYTLKDFLNSFVNTRLKALQIEDDRTANHEDRTAELESKIEELESQIEYYSDHEDRINNLEEQVEAVDRSQLLKDSTAIIDRRIHELAARGQLRIYVASTESE